MHRTSPGLAALPAAVLTAALAAQVPDNPPPWWGVADNDTVSLYWSFDNQAAPFVPTFQVVPSWYVAPPNNGFTTSPNVVWIAALGGHTGVLGFAGAGIGTISDVVDNDPRYDWIKVFFMQFDSTAAGAATVTAAIQQDLAQYDRAIVAEEGVPIGNGWVRTTVGALLLPQPNYETIDFTLTGAALATVAIDNLFANSKCIKPPPDQDGEALGDQDQNLLNTDLGALVSTSNNRDCTAVAATEDQNGVVTYWVAGRNNAGLTNPVYRLTPTGVAAGPPVQLVSALVAPLGTTDLAVARIRNAAGTTQTFVYGILDQRPNTGPIELFAIDAATGQVDPARTFPLAVGAAIPQQPLGLAFSPHGDSGNGTFWITDQIGNAYEFARTGALLRTLVNRLPPNVTGAGYDPLTAKFYWFSSAPRQPVAGRITQVNGFETSAYDFNPTGVEFFGDLRIPNPGGPLGGVARGLEVLRRGNGDFRLICVQQVNTPLGPSSVVRTLTGPYAFGWNLLGRCGMRGVPMEGVPNFQVTLTGVPRARFAMLYAGFSNTTFAGQQLPYNLGPFGMDESNISVALQMNSVLLPVVNGNVAYTIPLLPPGSGLSYVPMFFQWVVFDPSAPGGVATSQAGKTLIY